MYEFEHVRIWACTNLSRPPPTSISSAMLDSRQEGPTSGINSKTCGTGRIVKNSRSTECSRLRNWCLAIPLVLCLGVPPAAYPSIVLVVEKFCWHKKLHGLADSHIGFTPLNTSGCLFLFCAYFLWSRFAAWIWFHATLAEKIHSFLSLATITQRKHSPRLAGIAKIFSTRILRISHSINLQRSQLCRSTFGSK